MRFLWRFQYISGQDREKYVMRGFAKAASVLVLIAYPTVGFAFTPQWLECTGDVTVTDANGAQSKRAATDVYVVDSETKNLFRYSDTAKKLSYVGAKLTNNVLSWKSASGNLDLRMWEGQLDLGTMALQQTETGDGATEKWNQRCVPTSARPEA